MKKLILLSLFSLLFSFHLLADDTYKVRTEVFELELTKVKEIVPYNILTNSDKSLKITAKTSEIIDYLFSEEVESELNFDQMYKLTVESDKDIEEIKKDILYYFLKGAGLKFDFRSHTQTNYILSYFSGLDSCEARLSESDNATSQLNIQFKKRILLKGLSLESSVKCLNEALDTNIFEVGESDLVALPKMYYVKRKLQKETVEYLKSKGFEVEEIERVIETPVLVYGE